MIVEVIYGDPNTGKTAYVLERYDPENVYIVNVNSPRREWFECYLGERVVLLSNFRGQITASTLMQLLDDHDPRDFPYEVLCITSTVHPCEWYHSHAAACAIAERIDRLQYCRVGRPDKLREYLLAWNRRRQLDEYLRIYSDPYINNGRDRDEGQHNADAAEPYPVDPPATEDGDATRSRYEV